MESLGEKMHLGKCTEFGNANMKSVCHSLGQVHSLSDFKLNNRCPKNREMTTIMSKPNR